MNLHGKNSNKKKYMCKEISNPLFPISNKLPNTFNYYSTTKLNLKSDKNRHTKQLSTNDLMSFQNKRIGKNPSSSKFIKEINKTYSSEKLKNDSKINKSNNSKVTNLKLFQISSNKNNNDLSEKYSNYKNKQKSFLSEYKTHYNTNSNIEMPSKDNKFNINIISPKNLSNARAFNNKNTFTQPKSNIKRNVTEIAYSSKSSYYNNIIINNNSSNNINVKDAKKASNNNYLKIDISNRIIKTPKGSNVKLIFQNNNIFGQKFEETPILLKGKDSSSLPLTNKNSGNNLKISIDKNLFNGEYKIHMKKPNKKVNNENNYINMNLKNYIKNDKDENLDKNYLMKKKINGPEDLHFYYIIVIQEGKQKEMEFGNK